MDCVIKSSNRAYMLDWCLRSLKEHSGEAIQQIIVADDRTPIRYLTEIARRHPEVAFVHSGRTLHSVKGSLGHQPEDMDPVFECWRAAVKKCSGDYFLLLEDDLILSADVDFNCIEGNLRLQRGVVFNLASWNVNFEQLNLIEELHDESKIFLGRPSFLDRAARNRFRRFIAFLPFNRNRLLTLGLRVTTKLRITGRKQWLLNYQAYTVAGAVFSNDFWLSVWKKPQKSINEGQQMERSLTNLIDDASLKVGYIDPPKLKFTYGSAARENDLSRTLDFSVDTMNLVLNEAWLKGEWSINLGEDDLNYDQIIHVFSSAGLSPEFSEQWRDWHRTISANYQNLGFLH